MIEHKGFAVSPVLVCFACLFYFIFSTWRWFRAGVLNGFLSDHCVFICSIFENVMGMSFTELLFLVTISKSYIWWLMNFGDIGCLGKDV